MESLGNILETKTSNSSNSIFVCELCHYTCGKKFNWDRHIMTSKHIKETTGNILETKHEQNEQNEQNEQIKEFACENCNKEFKTRSGLWKHKKKCDYDENKQSSNIVSTTDMNNPVLLEKMFAMFTQMMTQNQDFMTNVIGKVQGNNTTHTNSHNTNNQFNIQMFLNEVCRRLICLPTAY